MGSTKMVFYSNNVQSVFIEDIFILHEIEQIRCLYEGEVPNADVFEKRYDSSIRG